MPQLIQIMLEKKSPSGWWRLSRLRQGLFSRMNLKSKNSRDKQQSLKISLENICLQNQQASVRIVGRNLQFRIMDKPKRYMKLTS